MAVFVGVGHNFCVVFAAGTVDDYTSWVPHLDNDNINGCLLGLIETFEKVKPDSFCTIDYDYERPHRQQPCDCTKVDYEW